MAASSSFHANAIPAFGSVIALALLALIYADQHRAIVSLDQDQCPQIRVPLFARSASPVLELGKGGGADRQLLRGFFAEEDSPVRWIGQDAAAALPVVGDQPLRLVIKDAFTQQPYLDEIASGTRQRIGVAVNGTQIGTLTLDESRPVDASFTIPADLLSRCGRAALIELKATYVYPGGGKVNAAIPGIRMIAWGARAITLEPADALRPSAP